MQDISQGLHSIIQFKLKQSLDEDLLAFAPNSVDYGREIQQLKAEVEAIKLSTAAKEGAEGSEKLRSLLRTDKAEFSLSDRTKSSLHCDNLQLAKMRQELDSLRSTVTKLSSSNILQFVSEAQYSVRNAAWR